MNNSNVVAFRKKEERVKFAERVAFKMMYPKYVMCKKCGGNNFEIRLSNDSEEGKRIKFVGIACLSPKCDFYIEF